MVDVVYGGVGGTAEGVAGDVARALRRDGWRARAVAADAWDLPLSDGGLGAVVVWVVATAGQGEMPPAMAPLWRRLRRRALAPDALAHWHTAVLGLGDSGYERFSFAAKMLWTRLGQLGARPLAARADADDRHDLGIHAAVDPWLRGLREAVSTRLPDALAASLRSSLPYNDRVPEWEVDLVDDGDAAEEEAKEEKEMEEEKEQEERLGSRDRPLVARLQDRRRLTEASWSQSVLLLRLALPPGAARAAAGRLRAGAVAQVLPRNPRAQVDTLLARCGWRGEARVARVRAAAGAAEHGADRAPPDLGPRPRTLRRLLEREFSLAEAPRRRFFELAAEYAGNPLEAERLRELADPARHAELLKYALRERRTVDEVLDDFPSVRLPLAALLETLPYMRARAYSLASAPGAAVAAGVELVAAVVRFRTPWRRERVGLCSRYLEELAPGAAVSVWLEPGSLRLPPPDVALLAIGPGTGVAAFRALAQERAAAAASGARVAPMVLYFGCRHRDRDYLFGDEWPELQRTGGLSALHVAFSRDHPTTGKEYVQHLLARHESDVAAHVAAGGMVAVCGAARFMPAQVRSTIARALGDRGSAAVDAMRRSGTYQEETWS